MALSRDAVREDKKIFHVRRGLRSDSHGTPWERVGVAAVGRSRIINNARELFFDHMGAYLFFSLLRYTTVYRTSTSWE